MKSQKYIIGITGGMGSGKSYISNILISKGFTLYFADDAAKEIMKQPEVLMKLQITFGDQAVIDNQINKQYLSNLFKYPRQLQKLNQIVHPLVQEHFQDFVIRQQSPIIFKEAAILFESGAWKTCNYIVNVFAPMGIRIQRLLQRDKHIALPLILQRIYQQWNDQWKLQHSHYTIFNDGLQPLEPQIEKLLSNIHKYAHP